MYKSNTVVFSRQWWHSWLLKFLLPATFSQANYVTANRTFSIVVASSSREKYRGVVRMIWQELFNWFSDKAARDLNSYLIISAKYWKIIFIPCKFIYFGRNLFSYSTESIWAVLFCIFLFLLRNCRFEILSVTSNSARNISGFYCLNVCKECNTTTTASIQNV